MARRDPVGVWLHGRSVAELTTKGRPGEVICRCSDEALAEWPNNTPLLSCSLPLISKPQQAGVFFRGLLPEGQHRQALAEEARLPTDDTFGLPDRPLGIHDDSELSIAGLQDKLLTIDLGDGRWGRPIHGRPSTHILKVKDRRYPGLVEMEAASLRLARAVGLTTTDATVEVIADVACLIVSRFDRTVDGNGTLTRVHQEDACQVLGRDPTPPRAGASTSTPAGQRCGRSARPSTSSPPTRSAS